MKFSAFAESEIKFAPYVPQHILLARVANFIEKTALQSKTVFSGSVSGYEPEANFFGWIRTLTAIGLT